MTDYPLGGDPVPDTPPVSAPLSPMFIWQQAQQSRSELASMIAHQRSEFMRELDKVTSRVDRMDEMGTRGVERLASEVMQLRKDITEHEGAHEKQRLEQVASRRWLVGTLVALTVPLYPLLGWLLVLGVRAHG